MRKVLLNQLRVQASVGILEHELRSKQQLLISLTVELPQAAIVPQDDDVRHVLDYRHLRDIAMEEAAREHVNMLETLAGRIAERLLTLPGVRAAQVRVVKPNIFPDCDGVAVEVQVASDTGAAP
jgi:7,8-dihydroneopterin aldolase/epimerase/oxygenase